MGRAGGGDGVLRHGAAVRQDAQAIREQADCFTSTGGRKNWRWMITEIVKGQLLALHVGRLKDNGKVIRRYFDVEDEQRGDCAGNGAQGARHSSARTASWTINCIMRHMNNLESVSTYGGDERHSQAGDR